MEKKMTFDVAGLQFTSLELCVASGPNSCLGGIATTRALCDKYAPTCVEASMLHISSYLCKLLTPARIVH